ncbi:unnamed protein product [Dicrocoelium dendriticum]|nr:unnamed protein product [Dicrocoelium dendriticum]
MAFTIEPSLSSLVTLLVEEVHHFKNAQICSTFYSLFVRYVPDVWNMLEGGYFSETFSDTVSKLSSRNLDACAVMHLELFFLIGFLRSDTSYLQHSASDLEHHITKLGDYILPNLSSCSVTLNVMAITLTELWWTKVTSFSTSIEYMFDLATKVCLKVLLHAGSDDRSVSTCAKSFLDCVLRGFESFPNSKLRSWVLEFLVGEFILSHPITLSAPAILSKGALRCLPSVLRNLGLNKILSLSPHLTTSLLICIGHNYTAATAAAVLVEFFNRCSASSLKPNDSLIPRLIEPVVSYILFAKLSCTNTQESFGCSELTLETAQANRRVNFAHHCFRKELLSFRLPAHCVRTTFPTDYLHTANSDSPLAELLLHSLGNLLQVESPPSITLHRQFFWEFLFAVHDDKLHLTSRHLSLAPLFCGLYHSDDLLRSLALRGLASLSVKLLKRTSPLHDTALSDPTSDVHLINSFTFCVTSLVRSTNTVARRYLSEGFKELVLAMRTAFSSFDPILLDIVGFDTTSNAFVLLEPDTTLPCSHKPCFPAFLEPHSLGLRWLPKLLNLLTELWGSCSSYPTKLDFTHCRRLAFWPGMTYQRAKNTLNLMRSSVEFLKLDLLNSAVHDKWLTGHSPGWQFRSANMLETLLYNLPLLTPDLQAQMLDSIGLNWPDGSTLLPADRCDLLVTYALQWCDSHITAVWTAGANLLTFCCSGGYVAKSSMSNRVLKRIADSLGFLSSDSFIRNENGGVLSSILNRSGLGYLLATANLLHLQSGAVPRDLICYLHSANLACCCLRIVWRCLELMGTNAWSPELSTHEHQTYVAEGAPSFRCLAQSILNAAAASFPLESCPNGTQLRDSDNAQFSAKRDWYAIELLPHYQHILSWTWNALRLSADVLARWVVAVQSPALEVELDDEISELCTFIGYQLVHILLGCRHRGTVEAVSSSLQLYLSISPLYSPDGTSVKIFTNASTSCSRALLSCEKVLNICWETLCRCRYSTTRRAAGLWPAVKAALYAEQSQRGHREPHLLIGWIQRLLGLFHLELCESQRRFISDGLCDPTEALALHILRGIFLDSHLKPHSLLVLGNPSSNFLIQALQQAVLPLFNVPYWTVSNAALQLHAALVLRLTGTDTGRPLLSAMELFGRFDDLFAICLHCLEEAICQHNRPSVTPTLVSVLSLLARLSQGVMHVCQSTIRMRCLLERLLLTHPSSTVRKLAAAAYLSLAPLSGPCSLRHVCCPDLPYVSEVGPIRLLSISEEYASPFEPTANALHGQLCLILAWLEQPLGQPLLQCRRSHFDWDQGLSLLHRLLICRCLNPAALYLSCCLCDVLASAFDSNLSTAETVRSRFTCWMNTHSSQLFKLSTTPFHEECILSLNYLARRITNEMPYMSFTISQHLEPARLSRFLHSSDDDNALLECVPVFIRHWLNQTNLTSSCALLCWRFVELWATGLVQRITPVLQTMFSHENALFVLRALLDANVAGSRDSLQRAKVLVCAASCLDDGNNSCPLWWVHEVFFCMDPNFPEATRAFASEALLLWQERIINARSDDGHALTTFSEVMLLCGFEQRKTLLHAVFRSLFDECAEIRCKMGTFVGRCCDQSTSGGHPTHMLAANVLLDKVLPLWFPTFETQVQWISDIWISIIQNVCQRIAEETLMKRRNALYELEAENAFCEPRLLLELLFRKLLKQTPNEEVSDDVQFSLCTLRMSF